MLRYSERAAKIEPFHAVQIYREALALSEHREITILCIGEPDFPTPARVVEAANRAALRGETHYTMPLGLPRLRRAISDHYLERYGASVPADRIAVTVGASGALDMIFAVLAESGDEVLMADPGYPSNRAFLHCYGAAPKCIPAGPEHRYQLTADLIEEFWGPRTIGVMLASPANPTGMCLPDDELRRIHEVVRDRGGVLIVDEIYHGLTYGPAPDTAASLGGEVFVVNSFSKYYCMTGWRLGWLVAPERWIEHIERVQGQLVLCPPAPSQWAALAALEPESRGIYESQRDTFKERRDFLVPALNAIGFRVDCTPDGAFYAYANISRYSNDSWQFCRALLKESGVALTPGRDFGSHRADEHVRISYTRPIAELADAIGALERFASTSGV